MSRTIKVMIGSVLLAMTSLVLRTSGQTPAGQKSPIERAVVTFDDKTLVSGAVLQGKYLVIHDEQKMARGEPCFAIYQASDGTVEPTGKPVVTFYCQTAGRTLAKDVVMTYAATDTPGVFELREIQFAGSSIGHRLVSEPRKK
ncbi:MAG TPA: hypothetical protein VJX67_09980 [Blastocatellia bacterium]|nr:hypothetical protein [Blastocatellia bacterium]